MENLKLRVNAIIKQYPTLKEKVQDAYDLAASEIEEGESRDNEIDHANNYLDEIIEEHEHSLNA